jgi:hypothetical protein
MHDHIAVTERFGSRAGARAMLTLREREPMIPALLAWAKAGE